MNHSPRCTGCPVCNTAMRAALTAFSSGDYKTYSALLTQQDAKFKLRTPTQETMMSDYTPPDSYAADLAKLRVDAARAAPGTTVALGHHELVSFGVAPAAQTPEEIFVAKYRAERAAEFTAEAAVAGRLRTAAQPAPTTDLEKYAAPDPYAVALAARKGTR